MSYELHHGDALEVLRSMPDASVDSVVTDGPYGIRFMGKAWDGKDIERTTAMSARSRTDGRCSPAMEAGRYDRAPSAASAFQAWTAEWAAEVLRVMKPGAHLTSFGAPRAYHRMACGLEDAGFDVRDSLHWIFGSGFPKSYDIAKGVESVLTTGSASWNEFKDLSGETLEPAGATVYGMTKQCAETGHRPEAYEAPGIKVLDPTTEAAALWLGWGTALKPAHEPIVLARAPLEESSIVRQVLATGTGALNVGACRVGTERTRTCPGPKFTGVLSGGMEYADAPEREHVGRWPPNLLLTHLPECTDTCAEGCAVEELGRQSGSAGGSGPASGPTLTGESRSVARGRFAGVESTPYYGDVGTASRFFPCFRYQAKPSKAEREEGLIDATARILNRVNPGGLENDPRWAPVVRKNIHPTVKPIDLMRWLVRLVTPPGGTVLDLFLGSGTTGIAALREGFHFVGIEREEEYFDIAEARICHAAKTPEERRGVEVAETMPGQGTLFDGGEES